MPNPTIPEIQTALGEETDNEPKILVAIVGAAINDIYVQGRVTDQGVTRWVATDATASAATQAAAINTDLAVG